MIWVLKPRSRSTTPYFYTTLLYECETWTTYRRHLKCLEKYNQRCLRRILKIRWQDLRRRTNNSVLEETNSTSIEARIITHQLSWAGHVVRMPDLRLPKQIIYSELRNGQHNQGGQFKRYKDVPNANMKRCLINTNDWENAAMDRPFGDKTSIEDRSILNNKDEDRWMTSVTAEINESAC